MKYLNLGLCTVSAGTSYNPIQKPLLVRKYSILELQIFFAL